MAAAGVSTRPVSPAGQRGADKSGRGDEVPEDAHEEIEKSGTAQKGVGRGIGEPAPRDHELERMGQSLLAAEAFAAGVHIGPERRGPERATRGRRDGPTQAGGHAGRGPGELER